MKITSVELHPDNSTDVAVFSFRDPQRLNPYNVKGIDGLDADAIIPRYYRGSGGSSLYNFTLEKRQVVIQVQLNPNFANNQSYSDLRDALYKKIASSRTGSVQLQFKNGANVVAVLPGFIAKFESSHFDKTPTVQITINCDEPMLKSPTRVSPTFGPLSDWTIRDDLSTAPHGFIFDLILNYADSLIEITDPGDASWHFEINPNGGFLVNDHLYFSSETNNKYLYIVRAGNTINLIDAIFPGSVWPVMFPGATRLGFSGYSHLTLQTFAWYTTYWGL